MVSFFVIRLELFCKLSGYAAVLVDIEPEPNMKAETAMKLFRD